MGPQVPFLHTFGGAQTAPHAPQFVGLEKVLVQRPPHTWRNPGELQGSHVPPMQNWPAGQAFSHEPQWFRSLWVSTQKPLQLPVWLHPHLPLSQYDGP